MNYLEPTQLMHMALDGEATPAQTRELERLLASDPAARAEYDDLQRLFAGLKGVPQAFPPEGLVSSVLASLPANANIPHPAARGGRIRQLFSRSRVIGADSLKAPVTNPGTSATVHAIRGPHLRGDRMSEQDKGSFGNRKIWIGAGVAAAAVIVTVFSGVHFPPGSDTAGTIVPAQRYRAPQVTEGVNPSDGGAAAGNASLLNAT